MTHTQLTDNVRQLVAGAFAALGLSHPDQFRESILIHDGTYCGRRFDGEGAHAVWFVEENQLKIMTSDGRVSRVLAADEQALTTTRAAA